MKRRQVHSRNHQFPRNWCNNMKCSRGSKAFLFEVQTLAIEAGHWQTATLSHTGSQGHNTLRDSSFSSPKEWTPIRYDSGTLSHCISWPFRDVDYGNCTPEAATATAIVAVMTCHCCSIWLVEVVPWAKTRQGEERVMTLSLWVISCIPIQVTQDKAKPLQYGRHA